MADNDQGNDEYQFNDMDPISPNAGYDEAGSVAGLNSSEEMMPGAVGERNIKKSVLIGVAAVILILVVYKFIELKFLNKSIPIEPVTPTVVVPPAPPPPAPPVAEQAQIQIKPIMPVPVVSSAGTEMKINQTLSTMEVSQESLRSDVTSVNNQLGAISNNLNLMMTKMTELNGVIASLSAKVDSQATVIQQLTVPKAQHKVHSVTHYRDQRPKFYLQAVIPGRAWLIATNGATLTVREGTPVAGYGIVKLIDPNQGRVTTSSGQVIQFSQEDS